MFEIKNQSIQYKQVFNAKKSIFFFCENGSTAMCLYELQKPIYRRVGMPPL